VEKKKLWLSSPAFWLKILIIHLGIKNLSLFLENSKTLTEKP
jgi:hypothetical protein